MAVDVNNARGLGHVDGEDRAAGAGLGRDVTACRVDGFGVDGRRVRGHEVAPILPIRARKRDNSPL
jgi:hypothetical protein